MVKILLMSDSHGNDHAIDFLLNKYPKMDAYIHCGDLSSYPDNYPNLVYVKGNNDPYIEGPYERVLDFEGTKIYMCHSHKVYGITKNQGLYNQAKQHQANVVFYGHTHVFADVLYHGIRMINPGSLYYNRDGSKPSYAIVTIDNGEIIVERRNLEE